MRRRLHAEIFFDNIAQRPSAEAGTARLDISRGSLSKIEARLRFVDDQDLMFVAKALKVPVQELAPLREKAGKLPEFIEKLETTRF
jgi:transcriptional regulator with XRE-family HTH domain